MALTAPIPTINGSQTEFSKVWIRGSTATATLPNIKLYSADGRAHHPYTGTLDVTIVHTAADTLYNRIQAAATAADATLTAARFDRWFKKAKITGFSCDAITGDTLLVNRSEDTGLTDTNLGDDGRLPAKAAATFYAQETYPVGRPFTHGNIPAEIVGLTGATVNVAGEVETATAWKVTQSTTTLAATPVVNDAITLLCEGRAQAVFEVQAIPTSVSLLPEVSVDGTNWGACRGYTMSATDMRQTTYGTGATAGSVGRKFVVDTGGYKYVRLKVTAVSGTGALTVAHAVTSDPFQNASPTVNSSGVSSVNLVTTPGTHGASSVAGVIHPGLGAVTAEQTLVTDGQATRHAGTPAGHAMTWQGSVPGADRWCYSTKTTPLTGDGSTTIAAAVTGKRNFVEHLSVMNKGSGNADVSIEDADGVPVWGPFNLDGDGAVAGMCPSFLSPMDAMDGATRGAVNKTLVIKVANTSGTVSIQATVRGFKSSMGV